MKSIFVAALAALLWLNSPLAKAEDEPKGTWDGLVQVKPKRIDAGFLLPGADFRPYKKIMMDPVEVAFKKDWLKNYNRDAITLSQRLSQEDLDKMAQAARENFTEIFTETYREAGYEIVTAPGPDVLRLRPGVMDLYVNAPDTMTTGRSRTYTTEAGEALLFLEVRDSSTGALLGRGLDRRTTRDTGVAQVSSRVTNMADFRALFKQWADISVKGFEDLRELSPIPETLEVGQKLKQ
jgi:Protein of unknown function (DUF3313)